MGPDDPVAKTSEKHEAADAASCKVIGTDRKQRAWAKPLGLCHDHA